MFKTSREPLPELAAFLAPFGHHFCRSEGRERLARQCVDVSCTSLAALLRSGALAWLQTG